MDEQELAVIETRAASAAGPYTARPADLNGWVDLESYGGNPVGAIRHPYATPAIVAFLTHAQTDVLALVAEVRRLQAALDKLDTDLGWFAAGMRDPG